MPYDEAADFEVPLAPAALPVDVPDPVADPTPLLASAVVIQVYLPRMTWELDLAAESESKVVQSISCWDWTLNPPATRVRSGIVGLSTDFSYMSNKNRSSRTYVVKLPERSIAPPTVERFGRSIAFNLVLLAI
jgi:hypothetical protein